MAADGPNKDAYERELRIAPVMTGGTSLAVWMGGVTAELYRVLMATREPRPSTRIYRELLQLTRTKPRVDVITGTSAGGLNGSLLAAAWHLNLPVDRFMAMRSIWLELGNLASLLRSPNEANPPSLLRGDDYFAEQLLEVLEGWNAYKSDAHEARPLDLYITVTTVHGEPKISFDDFGQKIGEVSHRQRLQFVKGPGKNPARDDFADDSWMRRLATASRTSASIPGVFEPSFLVVEGSKGDGDTSGRPTYSKDQASFSVSRWAVDGGVTVNLPLGEAIDRIFAQPASADLRRVVLYVKPTPTIPPDPVAERAGAMPTIAEALSTTSKAPRAEGIANDIDRIRAHNVSAARQRIARIARLNSSTQTLEQQAHDVWPAFVALRALRSVGETLDAVGSHLNPQLKPIQLDIEAALRGPRAKIMPADESSLGAVSGQPWGWGISSLEYCLNIAMNMLNAAFDLPLPDPPDPADATDRGDLGTVWEALHDTLDAVRLVLDLDTAFWEHRVGLLATVDGQDKLVDWAKTSYDQWPYAVAAGKLVDPQPPAIEAAVSRLRGLAPEGFTGDDPGARTTGVLEFLKSLGLRLASTTIEMAPVLRRVVQRAVEPIRKERQIPAQPEAEVMDELLEELRAWLTEPDAPGALPAHSAEVLQLAFETTTPLEGVLAGATTAAACLQNYLRLHVLDTVYQGNVTSNEQILELLQVSWDAPNELDARSPDAKLAGTEVARLGAFLKRSWRANDWMWGRLDGAQRMIVLLLEPKRLRQLGCKAADVAKVIDRLMTTDANGHEPDGPFLPEDAWNDEWRDRVKTELGFLDDANIPTPRSLPACTAALSYALQTAIAQEELPYLNDAIQVSRAEGATEGDDGAFRVLYKRKVQRSDRGVLGERLDPAAARELLHAVHIGEERAVNEIGSDLVTRTATQAAAVVVKAATGTQAGVPIVTRLARPLRMPSVVLYALGRGMTMRSRTAVALVALTLAVSGALLGVRIADASAVSAPVTVVAATVFVAALGLALIRSWLWVAIPTLVALVIVALAVVGEDVAILIFGDPDAQPPWKRIVFTNPWAVTFVVLLLGVVLIYLAFGRAVADHLRRRPSARVTTQELARLDRARYTRLFRRGFFILLLAPVTVLAWQWLMEQLVLGKQGTEPVKDWIYDAAKWLNDRNLVFVALALAALGTLVGIGYDRFLSRYVAWVVRVAKGPFRAMAHRGTTEGGPAVTASQPLPHPYSRMTGPQRWALFGVMSALLVGSAIALSAIDEFVPHGIVQFELNGAAGAHVWRSGVATAWSLIVDYPYLVAYGFVFSLVLAFFASKWNAQAHDADLAATEAEAAARALGAEPPSMERLRLSKIALDKRSRHTQLMSITIAASVLAWLPLVAAALDSMEDAFLLGYLAERPSWTADVARWFAISKFAVLVVAAFVLVVEVVALLTRRWWAKD